MIDKKIFYCWFGGGKKSPLNEKCIASWKKVCPDYEIIEINESNFDYHITPYCEESYEHGNWSYVSNAARLYTLQHNSGFYLDTDVQLLKSLDPLRIFDKGFITEFETSEPDSGVLGCGAEFSDFYAEVFENLVPGTVLHKQFIRSMYNRYDVHGESIKVYPDGFAVLGEEWFPSVRTDLITRNTIGIHYFENTWVKQWRDIRDGLYLFPKMQVYRGYKLLKNDTNPDIVVQIKSLSKPFEQGDMMCKLLYFRNPKVIKFVNKDMEATRVNYNKLAPTNVTVTPTNSIITWLDI